VARRRPQSDFSVAFVGASAIALRSEPFFALDEEIQIGPLGRAIGLEAQTRRWKRKQKGSQGIIPVTLVVEP
jgi:hypothetical protein